jgi:hypothetical protein
MFRVLRRQQVVCAGSTGSIPSPPLLRPNSGGFTRVVESAFGVRGRCGVSADLTDSVTR